MPNLSPNELPPVFKRARKDMNKKTVPSLVLYIPGQIFDDFYETRRQEIDKLKSENKNFDHWVQMCWFDDFWLEVQSCGGMRVTVMDPAETDFPDNTVMNVVIYNPKGEVEASYQWNMELFKCVFSINMTDRFIQRMSQILIWSLVYLNESFTQRSMREAVDTGVRLQARMYAQRGDSVVYKRLSDQEIVYSARTSMKNTPPGDSGIKKREHDVIGHWRKYPNGAKVWVRPHKRGDATLGRITRVLVP